jgi:hypothetical protein
VGNLRSGKPVALRLQGRELQGLAEPVVEEKQAIAAGLTVHLRKAPGDARYYGGSRAEEVEKAKQTVVMVHLLDELGLSKNKTAPS